LADIYFLAATGIIWICYGRSTPFRVGGAAAKDVLTSDLMNLDELVSF
jgi:hypothetical protein